MRSRSVCVAHPIANLTGLNAPIALWAVDTKRYGVPDRHCKLVQQQQIARGMRHLLSDLAIVIGGRLASGIATLLVVALLARTAPVSVLAGYSFALTLVLLLSIVCQLGLSTTVIRQVALAKRSENGGARASQLSASGLAVVGGTSLFVVAVAVLQRVPYVPGMGGSPVIAPEAAMHIYVWVALYSVQAYSAEVFRAHLETHLATLFSGMLSSYLLLTYLAIGAWRHDSLDLAQLFIANNLSIAASLLFAFLLLLKKRCLPFNMEGVFPISRELLSAGFFNMLVSAFSSLLLQSNMLVVAWLGTAVEVAEYSLANRLIAVLGMVSTLLVQVYAPRIASLAVDGDQIRLQRTAVKIAAASTVVALLPFVLLTVFPKQILALIFGASYDGAAYFVIVMVFAFFINALTGLRAQFLIQTGHQKMLSGISVCGGLSSLAMTYEVTTAYGVRAGVLASSAVLISVGAIEFLALYKKTGVISLPFLFKGGVS